MEKQNIIIGDSYYCKPIGYKNLVSGRVIILYEHTMVIYVYQCTKEDELTNREKQMMAVVRYSSCFSKETPVKQQKDGGALKKEKQCTSE